MSAGHTENPPEQPVRPSGQQIHQRETLLQIILPFSAVLLLIVGIFLLVALQNQPIWRIRAQAIADFMVSMLCLLPLVLCMFPVYALVLLAIFGMNVMHRGTERPLRKLELRASSALVWIETRSNFIREKTVSYSEQIKPIMNTMSVFEQDDPQTGKEDTHHETTTE
jgi:hypothetical protein